MHPRLHAQRTPDKPALIMSDTGETITYAALEARANQAAQAIRALGVQQGDTMAMICENRPEYLDIYWGAQRCGITLVPMSTRLTADEIAYILRDSESKLLVISAAFADQARKLAAMDDALAGLSLVTVGSFDTIPEWRALAGAQPTIPIHDERAGARMIYSSGTTGRPKGIRHPLSDGPAVQPNPAAAILGPLYRLDADAVYLSPAPLYHASPSGFTTAAQSLGGTVVLMPRFDAEAFLSAIERTRVTTVQVVPTMFIRLLKLPDAARMRYDISSLRTVVHAAAPCPVPVKYAMIDWFGPIIDEFYAGSEGNGHVTISSEEWLRKPGSVGRPASGTIHVCDDEGRELPVGSIGMLFFSGGRPFVYHNDQAKTAASRNTLHSDWTTMGDVGRLDEDGYLFLSDRKDFMIISGGVNIYPQEVENLLATHPKVADVAVFGVPHEEFGEAVKAVVQPADWSDAGDSLASELIGWCRSQLADFKCPRSIDFDPALPRAETGKLMKNGLKARYWPEQ